MVLSFILRPMFPWMIDKGVAPVWSEKFDKLPAHGGGKASTHADVLQCTRVVVSLREKVEHDDRCRRLLRKEFHARGRRMNAELQRFEVERAVSCDNDFTVQNTTCGQLRIERRQQFREVTVQRFLVATLDH